MASSPPHGACIVLMPPKMLVRHVDNSSMNGPEGSASTNLGKNSNVMTEKTVQRVAQQFMGGFKFEATGMVMCPSRRATGNPKTWCSAYREAIKHLTGQRQAKVKADLETAITEALDQGAGLTWDTALAATNWPDDDVPPGEAFLSEAPVLITPQGQNRAAMAIIALGGDLGIPPARAGEFGESNLFPDNGVAKTSALAEILKGEHAKFQVNVYDFLDYAAAAEKGTNLHRGESQSRECLLYEDGLESEYYCADTCDDPDRCADNETCVLTGVECIRAPCPPVASCEATGNCDGTCDDTQECLQYSRNGKYYCSDTCDSPVACEEGEECSTRPRKWCRSSGYDGCPEKRKCR